MLSSEDPAAAAPERALLGRGLDFWLLGGASLTVWLALIAVEGLRTESWAVGHRLDNVAGATAALSLICNYPHFMASYLLAYRRGRGFLLRHWWQLLAVPVLLVALLAAAAWLYVEPGAAARLFAGFNAALRALGLDTQVGTSPRPGGELMGLLVGFMYLTVGWHYSKQAYGCMMVYAHYDGYPLAPAQRAVLRWGLHAIWAAHFCYLNVAPEPGSFFGVTYHTLALPGVVYAASLAACVVGFGAVVHLVFVRNAVAHGRRPSANFLVPYLAFAVWWVPPLSQKEFLFHLVPFFHGLQYLAFVYKVQDARTRAAPAGARRVHGAAVALALVAAGFLSFELLPDLADTATGARAQLGFGYFLAAATLFINVHHYFIDNVIWRLDQPDTRAYLLS